MIMNKIQCTTFFFSLCFTITTFSQDFKFGKISKGELEEQICSIDSSANAAVLYSYRNTYFSANSSGIQLITEIHKRIKIYNNDGFDYATEVVNLFKTRSTRESVTKIKAFTYNLVHGEIVKTELEKDQVFKNDFSYNYNQVKFSFANVKAGSVLEFKYKISSPFYWNIDEFVLQSSIPIKVVDATLETPDGVEFNQTNKGYIFFYPKRTTKYNGTLDMTMDVNHYSLKNVPALKEESYVDNINNYRAGVMFELVAIKLPGMFHKYYAQSWSDVAKTIGNTDDYKMKLDKTRSFNDELDVFLEGSTTKIEKMKLLFKYVKDSITWNGIDGKYFYNGIKKALKEKKGNIADINLTLVAMLRYAGIDANPVVISTKENIIPFFPTVDRLNYVVAYAVIDDTSYFLDATDEFSDVNLLPIKDYNWKGILIDNNNMKWKKIDISEPDPANNIYSVKTTLNEDGSIEGSFNSRYTKHKAYEFRKEYKDQELEAFITKREASFKNIEISDYNLKKADVYEGFVTESFEYYQENAADAINDKIYFEPLGILKIKENPFKLEERLFPVDFGYPFSDKFIISIAIPSGFKVESNISPVVLKIPNNLGEFKYQSRLVGDTLQIMVVFKINKAIISSDNYLFLKEFFNQVVMKESEQIVLTKVE